MRHLPNHSRLHRAVHSVGVLVAFPPHLWKVGGVYMDMASDASHPANVTFIAFCPIHMQEFRPAGSQAVHRRSLMELEDQLPHARATELKNAWIHAVVGQRSTLECNSVRNKEETISEDVISLPRWKVEYFSLIKGKFCIRRQKDDAIAWDFMHEGRYAFFFDPPPPPPPPTHTHTHIRNQIVSTVAEPLARLPPS
jgi:hypothetical protein